MKLNQRYTLLNNLNIAYTQVEYIQEFQFNENTDSNTVPILMNATDRIFGFQVFFITQCDCKKYVM